MGLAGGLSWRREWTRLGVRSGKDLRNKVRKGKACHACGVLRPKEITSPCPFCGSRPVGGTRCRGGWDPGRSDNGRVYRCTSCNNSGKGYGRTCPNHFCSGSLRRKTLRSYLPSLADDRTTSERQLEGMERASTRGGVPVNEREEMGRQPVAAGRSDACGGTTDVHETARLAAISRDGGNGGAAVSDSRDTLVTLTARLRLGREAGDTTELVQVLQVLQRLTVSVESLMVSEVVAILRQLRGVADSSVATEATLAYRLFRAQARAETRSYRNASASRGEGETGGTCESALVEGCASGDSETSHQAERRMGGAEELKGEWAEEDVEQGWSSEFSDVSVAEAELRGERSARTHLRRRRTRDHAGMVSWREYDGSTDSLSFCSSTDSSGSRRGSTDSSSSTDTAGEGREGDSSPHSRGRGSPGEPFGDG